jgi:subtilisin family serine protease
MNTRRSRLIFVCATVLAGATWAAHPSEASNMLKTHGPRTIVDERFTVEVDATIHTSVSSVAAFGRRVDVAVGGLSGPDGRVGEFTTGELIIHTSEAAASAAEMLGGQIVATIDPAIAGISVPAYHLIAFDPLRLDRRNVAADLAALQPDIAHGAHRVSDDAAMGTLAAAASLARHGIPVALNWLTTNTTIRTRTTTEAPVDVSGFGGDAFRWSPLTTIGVPEAWNVLARAGRLTPGTIPLAIVDSGYSVADADRPAGGISDPPGPSPIGCSAGPCPFHGSDVANTAMAIPDNGFGAAGPAGPVATPILSDRAGVVLVGDLVAQINAVASGARILNMSFSGEVPAIAAIFMGGYDIFTAAVRAMGVLLVASAGNSGTDVDTIHCFIVCWEATFVFPCENTGVLCVGSLGVSGTTVTSIPNAGSNFGSGGLDPAASVDVWASNVSLVGPNDGAPANDISRFGGTSAAAPLVSGALALIWAANPAATANTVEALALGTARPGACLSAGQCAGRIPNTVAAVRAMLPNQPPDIAISATTPTTVPRGTAVQFVATASDPDGTSPVVRWFVDGTPRATGSTFSYITTSDSFGDHIVRATVTDTFGFTVPDAGGGQLVTLLDTPPHVEVTAPSDGAVLTQWRGIHCIKTPGTTCPNNVALSAIAIDANNDPSTLPAQHVTWHLDGSPIPFATGHNATLDITWLALGPHDLTVTATGGQLTAHSSVTITVIRPQPLLGRTDE